MDQNSFTLIHDLAEAPGTRESLHRGLLEAGLDVRGARLQGGFRLPFKNTPTHFARFAILNPPPGDLSGQTGARLLFNCDHDGDMRGYLRDLLVDPEIRSALHAIYSHCRDYGGWLASPPDAEPEPGPMREFLAYLAEKRVTANAEHRGYWGAPLEQVRRGKAALVQGRHILEAKAAEPGGLPRDSLACADMLRAAMRQAGIQSYRVSPWTHFLPRLLWGQLVPKIIRFIPRAAIMVGIMFLLAFLKCFFSADGLRAAGKVLLLSLAFLITTALALLFLAVAFALLLELLSRWQNRKEQDAADREAVRPPLPNPPFRMLENSEDRKFQNQMTHVSILRPGRALLLRWVLFPAVHQLGIGYFPPGSLGGITTIHFARWIILKDGTLLFLSNYDGSWESYLGDFVGKASIGLSGVWSATERFPRAFFHLLGNWIDGGARHEQRFKNWTRQYQQETQFWYSGSPGLSVRNARDGLLCLEMLGKSKFTKAQAETWLRLF
jgi:hypothetical protein